MSRVSIMHTMRSVRLVLILACAATFAIPVWAAPLAHREVLPNGIRLLVASRPAIVALG